MSSGPSYRRATQADTAALVTLIESAYRGDTSRQGWTTEADMLDGQRTDSEEIGDLIARADTQFLLAEQAGTLVACVCLTQKVDAAYLGMFAVSPTQQHQGLGRALLTQAERLVHEQWQAPHMEMTVIAQRPELLTWYERRGYLRTGEQRPFPYGNPRAGLPLREDLHFVVLRKALNR